MHSRLFLSHLVLLYVFYIRVRLSMRRNKLLDKINRYYSLMKRDYKRASLRGGAWCSITKWVSLRVKYIYALCSIKKDITLVFWSISIILAIFIIPAPVKTGMNTPQSHTIYLHNCLMSRTAHLFIGCLPWYNVVLTSRVHWSVKYSQHSCDSGHCVSSVLNHCLSWSKLVNSHLSHSSHWFNIHLFHRRTSPQLWLLTVFHAWVYHVRLTLRYTTIDIHRRDRRYEWDGGITRVNCRSIDRVRPRSLACLPVWTPSSILFHAVRTIIVCLTN